MFKMLKKGDVNNTDIYRGIYNTEGIVIEEETLILLLITIIIIVVS